MIRYLFLVAVVLGFCAVSSAAERPPNIVLIMADDCGYEVVRANGGESYQTPQLDELASSGMRFEHCYVQPLCTPTRVQLMTGLYNVRNYAQFGRIDRDATTFAHILKDAGYVTGIAGKWQLGRGKKLPQRLGFDEACLWQHTRRPLRYANPGLEYDGKERDFQGKYGPDLVNEFALDFITRHKERPFLLYYPMMLTHAPFEPTPDSADWDPAAGGKKRYRDVKHFADMVVYMDKLVGRVVTKLDELGIRDNTLVIFLGDNGTDKNVTSRFKGRPYPGGKGLGNARGTHVPLIANWPGRVPAGRVNADLIDSADFFPTLCDAAGAELPNNLSIDGRSFFPQLSGEKGQPREWRYSWYSKQGGPTAKFEFAMTTRHKLYRDGKFFDLVSDPFEEWPLRVEDLSDDDSKAAAMLQSALDQYADARPAEFRKPVVRNGKGRRRSA
jgi:arylsulfatase A